VTEPLKRSQINMIGGALLPDAFNISTFVQHENPRNAAMFGRRSSLAAVLDSDSASGIRVPVHNLSSPPASGQLAASSNQTLHLMTKTLRMRRAACPVCESPPHPFQASCLPRSWIATPASSNPAEYSPTGFRWCHTERSCVGRSALSSAAIWQLLNTRRVSVGGSASRKSRLTQQLRKALVKRYQLI